MQRRFVRNYRLLGRSPRTIEMYSRYIAVVALRFKCLPTEIAPEQLKDYLFELQQLKPSPSYAYFKFTVYSLRALLRAEKIEYSYLHLPEIKRPKKLPVILNREEVWQMLQAARSLKHKLILGMIYGCGLRSMELRNLRVSDIDLKRKFVHIKLGKGKKDRYIPLSEHLVRGLQKYIEKEKPKDWLFTGILRRTRGYFSNRSILSIVETVAKRAGIIKNVYTHMLRHSYATHMLEDGVNIVTLQKLLGHSDIGSTLVYLHVCITPENNVYNPLDKVFNLYSQSLKEKRLMDVYEALPIEGC